MLARISRRLVAWARALGAALAEPGPLETDAFGQEGAVFQRAPARKVR
jgi:hypothetical protein